VKPRSMALLLTLAAGLLGIPFLSQGQTNQDLILYQQVMSGQRKLESLTAEEQQRVIRIHTLVSRSRCEGCSEECRDAKDQAESARTELEDYTRKLYRCVGDNDLTDDCYSEFRRVRSAHGDFESAVSEVQSSCD